MPDTIYSCKLSCEEKERELLSRLRREMNGAVAGSMAEKGLVYGTNYGVSIADIRAIAKRFAPDHELAERIYRRDVRELKLATFLIADPKRVTPDNFDFWGAGITTTELGSNGALSLFSKIPAAGQLIFHWLRQGVSYHLMFCAVMTAAGDLMHREGRVDWEWRSLLDLIFERAGEHKDAVSKAFLSESLAALLLRLTAVGGVDKRVVSNYIASIAAVNGTLSQYLYREIGWALD